MDEVNNLFNPNRKKIVLEKQVTSDAKGEVDPNRKSLIVEEQSSSEAKVDPKEKEIILYLPNINHSTTISSLVIFIQPVMQYTVICICIHTPVKRQYINAIFEMT